MLKIGRPVTRETDNTERGLQIIITLHPQYATLHLKGTRESYNLSYNAAFWLAVKQSLNGGK